MNRLPQNVPRNSAGRHPYTLRSNGHRRCGAILSMELVLVVPIFLLILFSIVEFSLLSSARTRVTEAARHGARLVCITDRSSEIVKQEVKRVLGPRLAVNADVTIEDTGTAGQLVNVKVRVPMQNAAPDLLWMTGFSVRGRTLYADAPMAREHDIARSADGPSPE